MSRMRIPDKKEHHYFRQLKAEWRVARDLFKPGCTYRDRERYNHYKKEMEDFLKTYLIDMDAPRPCPFCGNSVDLIEYDHNNDNREYEIQCDCGIMTTSYDTVKELLDCWNTRIIDKE